MLKTYLVTVNCEISVRTDTEQKAKNYALNWLDGYDYAEVVKVEEQSED